jgi:PhoH-like ATPase
MPAKKNYILDTSVCLTDADAINKFGNHDIFLPLKVLEEIDKHKKRQDSVGINARKVWKFAKRCPIGQRKRHSQGNDL